MCIWKYVISILEKKMLAWVVISVFKGLKISDIWELSILTSIAQLIVIYEQRELNKISGPFLMLCILHDFLF